MQTEYIWQFDKLQSNVFFVVINCINKNIVSECVCVVKDIKKLFQVSHKQKAHTHTQLWLKKEKERKKAINCFEVVSIFIWC